MIQDQLLLTGINILLAWSIYVFVLAGGMSFAQAAFMAIGAYASGILTTKFGVPFLAAIVAGLLASGLVAVLVGLPALRAKGVYLLLVTVGLTFIVRVSLENTDYVGGVEGLKGMFGTGLTHVAVAVAAVAVLLLILQRSALQRALDAVRDDEKVAASIGINVN